MIKEESPMKKLIALIMALLMTVVCFTPAVSEQSGGASPDILKKLAGTWTGVGTPANGGTAIDLSVTIKEDGSGEYLFSQGGYEENFPFSISYSDNTFSVDIPATAGLGSVTGTYQLNNDLLTLEITTVFPNGRQYRYTAVCTKIAGAAATDPGTWVCPDCQAVNEDAWKFCVSCGHKKPVAIVCPGCGAEYPEDVTFAFCHECGTRLEKPDASGPSQEENKASGDDPDSAEAFFSKGAEAEQAGNPELAASCYQQSADLGYAAAQDALGTLYVKSLGVEQSYSKAVKYYRLAADQGNEHAAGVLKRVEEAGNDKIKLIQAGVFYDTDKGTRRLTGPYVDESLFPGNLPAGIYYTLDYSANIPEGCVFSLVGPDGTIWETTDNDLKDAAGQAYTYYSAKGQDVSSLVPGNYYLVEGNTILGRFTVVKAGKNKGSEYVSYDGPVEILLAGIRIRKGNQAVYPLALNVVSGSPDPEAEYSYQLRLQNSGNTDVMLSVRVVGKHSGTTTETAFQPFELGAGKTTSVFSKKRDLEELSGDYTVYLNGKEAFRFVIVDEETFRSSK